MILEEGSQNQSLPIKPMINFNNLHCICNVWYLLALETIINYLCDVLIFLGVVKKLRKQHRPCPNGYSIMKQTEKQIRMKAKNIRGYNQTRKVCIMAYFPLQTYLVFKHGEAASLFWRPLFQLLGH